MERESGESGSGGPDEVVKPGILRRLRSRLTYANVTATIAGFFSVGGASYAVSQLPPRSVGNEQLKTGAVDSRVVKDHSLQTVDIHPGATDLSGAEQSSSRTVALSSLPTTIATTKLRTDHKTGLLSFGSVTLIGGKGGGSVSYRVVVDGKPQGPTFTETLGPGEVRVVPIALLTAAIRGGGGPHTVQLQAQLHSGAASVGARDFGVIAGCRGSTCC